jgi:uncharacterized protein DUF11
MQRLSFALLAAAAVGAALVAGYFATAARAASPIKVTITIHDVWEVDCDDNDVLDVGDTCGNDYYVKVFLPGSPAEGDIGPRAADDLSEVHPNWQLSRVVDRDAGPFTIRIQLWDHDSTSGDDQIDIAGGDDNLDFSFDPVTGLYSGPEIKDVNTGWATGSGTDSAAIFFSVTLGESVDFDGDGLHDGIERGAIVDRSGNIPQNGILRFTADPCRPTLLTEIDYMDGPDGPDADTLPDHTHRPLQAALDEAVAAFAAGDVPARAGCPYHADSPSGVQLLAIVDDNLGLETDRINWNTPSGAGAVNGQTIRNANFDSRLRPYFHYSLWNHNQPNVPVTPSNPTGVNSSSGLCCSDSGKDVMVSLGQWANSVGTVRDQAGTFVHEFGHALGLGHGGGDSINCKPNYLSIMSYVYQTTGIPDASLPAPTVDLNGDGTVDGRDRLRLDLSRSKLNDLDEDSLNEGAGIGAGSDTFFWDGDGATPWRSSAGNVAVDWDRDNPTAIDAANVAADINFMGIPGNQGCPTATPPPGSVGITELNGYDDWANLKYKGPLSAPGGGVSVSGEDELDLPRALFIRAAIREAMSLTDLHVHLSDSPDPVGAGTQLTYTVGAHNHGAPNTAYGSKAVLTLPADVTFASASTGCTHSAGVVTCALGEIAPNATASATVTVDVPANLVYVNGGPKDVTASATVSHDGGDSDTGNNTQTATTRVVAVADLDTVSVATSGAPAEMIIGTPAQFTLTRVIDNHGPSAPIDATVTTTGSASAGAAVVPAFTSATETALLKDTQRTISEAVTVTCAAPGPHVFTLTAGIAPKNAADTDPNPANDSKSVSVTIDCVVPVAINIGPHDADNRFSSDTADVNVALLTTRAGEYGLPLAFDARTADVLSIRFGLRAATFAGGGAPDRRGKGQLIDSWERSDESLRDGDVDMELRFVRAQAGIPLGTGEACMKGVFTAPGGTRYKFFGCDSITIHGTE